jgi:hypothetical protein
MTTQTMSVLEDPKSWAEERIALQAQCLRAVVSLIQNEVPLASWPRQELSVLAGALRSDGLNDFEDRKARNLERHLFRGESPAIHAERLPEMGDLEERVRADLPSLVRLGSGRRL